MSDCRGCIYSCNNNPCMSGCGHNSHYITGDRVKYAEQVQLRKDTDARTEEARQRIRRPCDLQTYQELTKDNERTLKKSTSSTDKITETSSLNEQLLKEMKAIRACLKALLEH